MGFEQSFSIVSALVKDFQANEKYYLSSDYSEIDVRRDFIDKFFATLGWDVTHDIQKNPYEQEVRVERLVQVAKAQKRADYSFYLAPNFRDVKFFVEAKKPSRNLENADDFFQTVRYGWNATTPIAILTDFEELIIVDCRFRPDIGNILNSKIERFHYTDYLNEEKFRKIYHLFSHEAVADNSIEKYADALPKPKGKALKKGLFKGGYQSIDEAFLLELDEIRESLAKSFKKNNEHLSSEELTEATQRVIDRLVFIRFLEDKLIEPHHYLSEFGDRKTAWEDFLLTSRSLDAKYNGIVFKKHQIDSHNIIEPDDKTFSFICEELSHLNSPYDFDKIPIHILGSIYERFLGKIVNATGKRVTIEEKPEVRKAGGVYYTPQYIVNYIVDNTVGKLIEGKTPKEISKMHFADIACGSGSFLITVFERLLDYHKLWYQANPKQAEKDKCVFVDDAWRLTLLQKQKILLKNIYGIDIDQQAVEVTQLSLYLKLLEDETTATANDTWVLFKEKLLPNLNKNIICGNSLIGSDIFEQQTSLPFTKSLSRTSFGRGTEGGLDELKLKPMNFEDVFPEIMNEGGFDAIVGNPPYVNLVAIPADQRKYFQKKFRTCKNKSDLYSFFIEKALSICKNKNYKLGYIVPHTWLATDSFSLLRKLLLDEEKIEKLVELGFGVFKKVVVSTLILICSNDNKRIEVIDKKFNKKFETDSQFWLNDNYHIDLEFDKEKQKIFDRLKVNTTTLDKLILFTRGIKTSNDQKFISRENSDEDYKKLYRGRNIKAYRLDWEGEYIWYRPDLMKKKVGSLPHSKELFEVPEKLISQRVNSSMQLLVAYDGGQNYFLDTTNVSRYESWDKKHSLKFILAILNSRLINYWYTNKYKMPTIGLYELHSIPVKVIDFNNDSEKTIHDKISSLATQMLTTKKQLQQAKTESDKEYLERKCDSIDKQIDQLVYQLYGSTEEEIRIVEGNIK
ncbi:MAG: hypothetical protein A2V93_04205 [Ignavibacteria bacterium RBG_16_34_14]|nr:MAG: hypothetical protein A2V93_04205 [Ignavibacteria bacterium RBG_16_34_14]